MEDSDERFEAASGRCWRFVEDADPQSAAPPVPCPTPITVRGIFLTAAGWRVPVESCAEHASELEDVRSRTLATPVDPAITPPGTKTERATRSPAVTWEQAFGRAAGPTHRRPPVDRRKLGQSASPG